MNTTKILIYLFGAIVFLVGVPFLIWFLVVGPLVVATRESLRRNTTRGFMANAGANRPLILTLVVLPVIILLYLINCIVVCIRLLFGVPPGVTSRHVNELMRGAVIAAVATGCASAFLIVPLIDMWWDRGSLEAKGLGGLYWFLSKWWLTAVMGIALGAVIGLSRVEAQDPNALDPLQDGVKPSVAHDDQLA
jgi:hypothetical protein